MKLISILSTSLLCATMLSSSYAMDGKSATQVVPEKQMSSVTELLCCLALKEVPSDIHPLLITFFVFANAAQEFKPLCEGCPKILCGSLLRWCKNIPTLPRDLMPYEQLGALFASYCAKNNINLVSLADCNKQTILHNIVLTGKKKANVITKSKAIQILHNATKSDVHTLSFAKDHSGWTALHWAASEGDNALVQQLLSPAQINKQELVMAKDLIDQTALHSAVSSGHLGTIQELLRTRGINAQELAMVRNFSNQTALDLAKEKNLPEIVQLLQPYTN